MRRLLIVLATLVWGCSGGGSNKPVARPTPPVPPAVVPSPPVLTPTPPDVHPPTPIETQPSTSPVVLPVPEDSGPSPVPPVPPVDPPDKPDTRPTTAPGPVTLPSTPADPFVHFKVDPPLGAARSSSWICTNWDSSVYYDQQAKTYDLRFHMSGWYDAERYTLNGYPAGSKTATCQCTMIGYPSGRYHLVWTGTANWYGLKLWNRRDSAHRHEADIDLVADKTTLLHVNGLTDADPFDDMHVYVPGYDPASGLMYRKETTRFADMYGGIRAMDLGMTNNAMQVTWDQRVKATDFDQTSRGMAYEYIIQLARETNKKILWVCVPRLADDDYMTQMANTLKAFDGLVMVELSNEVWNSGMWHTYWPNWCEANPLENPDNYDNKNVQTGKLLKPISPTKWNGHVDPNGRFVESNQWDTPSRVRAARCQADRAYRMGQVWIKVFGDRAKDHLAVVWAGQAGWYSDDSWQNEGAKFINAKYKDQGGMASVFKYLAIAPYFSVGKELDNVDNPSIDQVAASLQNTIRVTLPKILAAANAICKRDGLKLAYYECGQHLTVPRIYDPAANGGKGGWRDMTEAEVSLHWSRVMQDDPRMVDLYYEYLKSSRAAGVDLAFMFSYIGPWSKYGHWGMLQRPDDDPTVRYKFIGIRRAAVSVN